MKYLYCHTLSHAESRKRFDYEKQLVVSMCSDLPPGSIRIIPRSKYVLNLSHSYMVSRNLAGDYSVGFIGHGRYEQSINKKENKIFFHGEEPALCGVGTFAKVKNIFSDLSIKSGLVLRSQRLDSNKNPHLDHERRIMELAGVLIAEQFEQKSIGKQVFYQVVDEAPGRSLFDIIMHEPHILSACMIFQIMWHAVVELDKLHQKGIIHLDLKLENIHWDQYTNTLRILDLGFAHLKGEEYRRCGSLRYVAPEMLGYVNRDLVAKAPGRFFNIVYENYKQYFTDREYFHILCQNAFYYAKKDMEYNQNKVSYNSSRGQTQEPVRTVLRANAAMDIYALGMTFKYLLQVQKEIIPCHVFDMLKNICSVMTHLEHYKRIGLDELKIKLKEIEPHVSDMLIDQYSRIMSQLNKLPDSLNIKNKIYHYLETRQNRIYKNKSYARLDFFNKGCKISSKLHAIEAVLRFYLDDDSVELSRAWVKLQSFDIQQALEQGALGDIINSEIKRFNSNVRMLGRNYHRL
jgi:serine/threonine protein kinase